MAPSGPWARMTASGPSLCSMSRATKYSPSNGFATASGEKSRIDRQWADADQRPCRSGWHAAHEALPAKPCGSGARRSGADAPSRATTAWTPSVSAAPRTAPVRNGNRTP